MGPGQHQRSGIVAQAGEGSVQEISEDSRRLERMRSALDLVQSFPAGPLARAKVKQLQNLCQIMGVPQYGTRDPMLSVQPWPPKPSR